jgi:outer membrane protein OmpA-like peptidoglycan-associated protein
LSFEGALGGVIEAADAFRGHAVEWFGPLAGTVTTATQIFAAVLALLLVGAGRRLWAPPGDALSDFAPRIAGLVAVVGVVFLFIANRDAESTVSFLRVAIWAAAILVVSAIAYFVCHQFLTFRCEEDKTVYVRGFRVQRDARRVLDNDQGPPPLPKVRTITGEERPIDACDYFCKADRSKPEFIWTRGSHVAAQLVLTLLYIPLAISIIILLAASAFALQQADSKVIEVPEATITQVPADLLFDYKEWKLKPTAGTTLESTAKLIHERWKAGPVIVVGYTDSIGGEAYNAKLSLDRAKSVAQWLATTGRLATVPFDVQGRGAQSPVAPNTFPDGSDNPEGRRLNRRVIISVPKEDKVR